MLKMGVNEQLEELVNSKFTEETLKTILIKHFGGKVVGNVNFENQGGTAKGDSYLSTVNKLKVKGEVDGSAKSVDVIVKSLPQNIARRKTYRSVEFFTNEINFYEQVSNSIVHINNYKHFQSFSNNVKQKTKERSAQYLLYPMESLPRRPLGWILEKSTHALAIINSLIYFLIIITLQKN